MDAPSAPPVTPWHKRVLGWLGVELPAEAGAAAPPLPAPEHRFAWEPVPPAPRPPQWGAANLPELLAGLENGIRPDAAADGGTPRPPGADLPAAPAVDPPATSSA